MTREEAIDIIKCLAWHTRPNEEDVEQAIKTLEQEPCSDAISRQAVLNTLDEMDKALDTDRTVESYKELLTECYKVLPSVKQEPKTGYWIDDNENEIDAQYGKHIYRCSECNKYANDFVGGIEDWWDLEKPNYCPNCGAKMEKED